MQKQIEFYENKLAYEMDPSDLWDALENNENTIALDARKVQNIWTSQKPMFATATESAVMLRQKER